MVVIMRCVGSTDRHLLLCRWSLMIISFVWGVCGLCCSWAVSVDLSRIISLMYGIWFAVCVVYRRASVFASVGVSCIIFICCEVCEVRRPAPGWYRWVSHASYCFVVVCVRSTDLLMGCVGGSLTHRLIHCIWCDVCEVYRPAPGLCRRASHASSRMLWCVWGLPTYSWAASLGLSRIILFCCGVCGVSADLLMGCVGGSLKHHLISFIVLMCCVWGLPTCSWLTSVGLSCIFSIVVVCVTSTDLLLGCVGGSLISHILLFLFSVLLWYDYCSYFLIYDVYSTLMGVQFARFTKRAPPCGWLRRGQNAHCIMGKCRQTNAAQDTK